MTKIHTDIWKIDLFFKTIILISSNILKKNWKAQVFEKNSVSLFQPQRKTLKKQLMIKINY